MVRFLAALAIFCVLAAAARADNWPGWRGPTGQGHSAEKDLPLTWSAKENVRWKVKLPDAGTSTPVIWDKHVFLTQASDREGPPKGSNGGPAKARKRSLMCFARADGTLLWQKDVAYDEIEYTHPTNPFCAASPATDGERVVVSHGSAGMYCYDFAGKELWKYDLGKLEHVWGNASSPVLYKDLVIMWAGPGERQFLVAVNKKSGQKVWQHDEPGGADGIKDKTWIGSWSTPIIAKVDGQDQLILGVPKLLKGFDPATGKELWSCAGMGNLVYTSPVYADGIAVAMSGFHQPALAVKLGGAGDITNDRLWHHAKQNPQRIGTGVIVGGHLYMMSADGVPQCFDIKTGDEVWKVQDRPGSGAWGSMVHAAGRLYITMRNGTTLVLAASPKYEELAINDIGNEHTDASIAPSDGQLFIRSYKHLWCIGK
jgi:outer membrane protein assembly factor BamB